MKRQKLKKSTLTKYSQTYTHKYACACARISNISSRTLLDFLGLLLLSFCIYLSFFLFIQVSHLTSHSFTRRSFFAQTTFKKKELLLLLFSNLYLSVRVLNRIFISIELGVLLLLLLLLLFCFHCCFCCYVATHHLVLLVNKPQRPTQFFCCCAFPLPRRLVQNTHSARIHPSDII